MPTKTPRRPIRAIPPAFLEAKAEAVSRFLGSGPDLRVTPALAASTRPEHNVVGVGIGPKVKGGKTTTRRSIRFYVVRKVPSGSVPSEFALPRQIRGVPTDVIETGRFVALVVPIAQRRLRPAKGGCSVGFQFSGNMAGYVMAGTFGALVGDANGAHFILSNNHVLANENALPIGSPIFQPGLLDHGNPASDEIAKLTRFVRIQPVPAANSVDAAIARLDAPNLAVATILPQVGRLASPAPVAAAEGMKVHKHGRTTGYRRGHIVDVSADVTVGYDFGNARFNDQMLIVGDAGRAFSAAGDSGSLIVDRSTRRATGLLFAGSPSHTIANHIEPVLTALGVNLL
jgi:hypothetical protein